MSDKHTSEPSQPKVTPKRKPAAQKTAAAVKKSPSVAPKPPHKNGSVPAAGKKVAHKRVSQQATAVDRAEDTLDDFGKLIGGLLAGVGGRLRKVGAVAREEMEDLWAEAQSIRRGDTK
jgi:hypothetical protein